MALIINLLVIALTSLVRICRARKHMFVALSFYFRKQYVNKQVLCNYPIVV